MKQLSFANSSDDLVSYLRSIQNEGDHDTAWCEGFVVGLDVCGIFDDNVEFEKTLEKVQAF